MITLITGGSGSGKSAYAEKYICHVSNEKGYKEKYYIATMQIFDDEGQRKIDRHRRLRAGKALLPSSSLGISKMLFLSCNQKAV